MKVINMEEYEKIEKRLRLIMDKTYPLCEFPMEDIAVAARDCNNLAYECLKIAEHHIRPADEKDSILSNEPSLFKPSKGDPIEKVQ